MLQGLFAENLTNKPLLLFAQNCAIAWWFTTRSSALWRPPARRSLALSQALPRAGARAGGREGVLKGLASHQADAN